VPVIFVTMVYLSRNFPVDMVKELHTPGPFSRRASTTIDYKETKRIATYAGPELTARDSTALFIDWDDTLFPSTWVQMMQLRYKKAGQPFDLQSMRKMKEMQELSSEIKAFLLAASKVGHVFLVTAAAHGFVRKCCRIFFPELRKVLDDLQVTIIYARPQVDAEQEVYKGQWKDAAFSTLLQAPYERPLPPQLARFYNSEGWQNMISYGDQWTDHASLLRTAEAFGLDAPITTVKAQEGLSPEALGEQLRMVGKMLPSLAESWTRCSYDLADPGHRAKFDLPAEACESMIPASFRSLGSSFYGLASSMIEEPLCPKSKSPLSRTPSTPSAPRSFLRRLSSSETCMDTEYVSSKEYAEDPDYTESMETPNYRNGSARSWADHGLIRSCGDHRVLREGYPRKTADF
jgi:hypothetical protein